MNQFIKGLKVGSWEPEPRRTPQLPQQSSELFSLLYLFKGPCHFKASLQEQISYRTSIPEIVLPTLLNVSYKISIQLFLLSVADISQCEYFSAAIYRMNPCTS